MMSTQTRQSLFDSWVCANLNGSRQVAACLACFTNYNDDERMENEHQEDKRISGQQTKKLIIIKSHEKYPAIQIERTLIVDADD